MLYYNRIGKAIMNAHGGTIDVRSTGVAGQGCVFWVEVKICKMIDRNRCADRITDSETIKDSGSSMTEVLPFDKGEQLRGMMVLVVDDSPLNRKMLVGHLKKSGVSLIEQASNGLEAAEMVEGRMTQDATKQFDIIFMDCNMPVMGGNDSSAR
jgi:PleD family two-component response regulator